MKLNKLMNLLPGIAASMGYPLPPGLDISALIPDDDESQRDVSPLEIIAKLRMLNGIDDKAFRKLVMNALIDPKNGNISIAFLELLICTGWQQQKLEG